ncbi:unnamed protein product [Urochloa decumbens]|uniref:DUF4220 domain-containing protein n=1 Tax=Urochloa decumbens TaxID=240449 RepID=A0ABC9D8H7_9POAL
MMIACMDGQIARGAVAMGFQPWVPQQENNWEIRVVMLLSLLFQVLLIFLGPMRKRSSSPLLRFAVWSSYLLADWVADLALGLILNSMGVIGGGGSSSPIIFAFWTPFLLLHLGGPDTITSYSLEDNELWLRHLIGLLFELSSVIVIFGCSVRGNPMILATVLIVVVGVIKYCERTYSLYRGSIKGFSNNMPQRDFKPRVSYSSIEARAFDIFRLLQPFFMEMTISTQKLKMVWDIFRDDIKPSKALKMIELELNFVYDIMYTKAAVAHSRAGWVLRFICSGCIVSALAIFFSHDKGGMKRVDVSITFALLLGALALDVAAMAMFLFSDRAAVFLQESRRFKWLGRLTSAERRVWRPRRWSETTSRLNLISDCLGEPQHHSTWRRWLMMAKMRSIAKKLRDLFFIWHKKQLSDPEEEEELPPLLDFIFRGVKDDAVECRSDMRKIWGVCNSRGERVLERLKSGIMNSRDYEWLMRSVKKDDFDEQLLTWHIATDICLLDDGGAEELTKRRRLISETLSEYLLYLLVKQSEMVSAKMGVWLSRYQDTRDHVKKFLANQGLDHDGARRQLQGRLDSVDRRDMSVLFDAIHIADFLMQLPQGPRWELVSGVWKEMLTYTATKCRATTHIRQLNRGGELITLVWLLRENMGAGELQLAKISSGQPG